MYYMNLKQEKIFEFIRIFRCAKLEHLKGLLDIKDIEKHLKTLISEQKIYKIDDIYLLKNDIRDNSKILKALDLYVYLRNKELPIHWCIPEDFPFIIAFFRNNKVFDVAVVKEGEESLYSTVINRSISDRVILILYKREQQEKIKIEKQVKFCTIENGAVYFF
ncbi:DUF5697 family protein [Clostridium felsineum]|uniref:DUF5697 family protein n=1 Tax=Clostridium felsineum TaxID=36839 RepID=UPI00098C4D30|nr:DUF5697 family protein [Clostridium felsineum]URZ00641.1 hypothetical protein CLAUR_006290 [Clostridium felsineum]